MSSDLFKRITILVGVALLALAFISMFAYDVIKLDWVSFMEIQPAFQPMYNPLPVPAGSIPIDGSVYVPSEGVPANPIPAEAASITRGMELYHINCIHCHGPLGKGDGTVAIYLQNKPANLTGLPVRALSDGGIFLTISDGIQGKMPALNENLTVRERWDVVNYVRSLK
jgi:mono/diheme cytochrome c family protein